MINKNINLLFNNNITKDDFFSLYEDMCKAMFEDLNIFDKNIKKIHYKYSLQFSKEEITNPDDREVISKVLSLLYALGSYAVNNTMYEVLNTIIKLSINVDNYEYYSLLRHAQVVISRRDKGFESIKNVQKTINYKQQDANFELIDVIMFDFIAYLFVKLNNGNAGFYPTFGLYREFTQIFYFKKFLIENENARKEIFKGDFSVNQIQEALEIARGMIPPEFAFPI